MKSQTIFFSSSRTTTYQPYQPSANRIKVSLFHLVEDLLISLDPLARKNNNVVINGVPRGLCFVAEENVLAYVLWNLLSTVVTYLYRSLAPDYRKLQDAAIQLGGSINLYNDEKYGNNLAFSISNTRMAV